MYDYFYGAQADQFSFIRIPTVLFSQEQFRNISPEAKVLYGILLKRMDLSAKNGWFDDQGRVYIICTLEEIMETLNCGNQKAVKLMDELEGKIGLIERKRQGLGKPNLIYVKNFICPVDKVDNSTPSHFLKCENHTSGDVKITLQEVRKSHGSNTDNNDTENSYTDNLNNRATNQKTHLMDLDSVHLEHIRNHQPNNNVEEIEKILDDLGIHRGRDAQIRPADSEIDKDEIPEWQRYECYFKKVLDYESLCRYYPNHQKLLFDILNVLVETCCSKQEYIRVGGYEKPANVVKGQLMKLKSDHIRYTVGALMKNSAKVHNLKSYLLTILYKSRTIL